MRLNLHCPFRLMRNTLGGMAITPTWLARCIISARTSSTHPHDPYVARRCYWDFYADCDDLMPHVPALDFADQYPHSQRLFLANDYKDFDISDEDVRRSRRSYFANISYLDAKIGALMTALAAMRMDENIIILFCSDHGDMLGERGLWFKLSFFI